MNGTALSDDGSATLFTAPDRDHGRGGDPGTDRDIISEADPHRVEKLHRTVIRHLRRKKR